MERPTQNITITKPEDIPSGKAISTLSKDYNLVLCFEENALHLRETVGESLTNSLPGHLVGVPVHDPKINISRLISYEDIGAHRDFFEQCAKDHRELASRLMKDLAGHLKTTFNPDFPSLTINPLKATSKNKGTFGEWKYYLHGFHCLFVNTKTQQEIEAPIMFGSDYGELDPYFFTKYIVSTPQYQPLPVSIYQLYHDGARILDEMLALGKFERVASNWPGRESIVVKDREKIEIKVLNFQEDTEVQKPKFNILKYLGIKP